MDGIVAVAFPTDCSLCGAELSSAARLGICPACWASLQAWPGPVCACCGLPFPSTRALDSSAALCGACRADSPAFNGVRSFGLYIGKLRQAVLRLKFGGDERLGWRLGELLVTPWEALSRLGGLASPLIVPVPLHPSRRRERGYNQSELLAAGLAQALGKQNPKARPETAKACLRRQRATPPQTGLSVAARQENLRGAFEAAKPAEVYGRAIVLIDDVMTTGATLSACARVLKRAGAAQVWGVTLARATPQFPDFAPMDTDNPVDGLDPDWR